MVRVLAVSCRWWEEGVLPPDLGVILKAAARPLHIPLDSLPPSLCMSLVAASCHVPLYIFYLPAFEGGRRVAAINMHLCTMHGCRLLPRGSPTHHHLEGAVWALGNTLCTSQASVRLPAPAAALKQLSCHCESCGPPAPCPAESQDQAEFWAAFIIPGLE